MTNIKKKNALWNCEEGVSFTFVYFYESSCQSKPTDLTSLCNNRSSQIWENACNFFLLMCHATFIITIIISATTGVKRQIDKFVNYTLYRDQLICNCLQNAQSTMTQITFMNRFAFHYVFVNQNFKLKTFPAQAFKSKSISLTMCFCRYMLNINNLSRAMLLRLCCMRKKHFLVHIQIKTRSQGYRFE